MKIPTLAQAEALLREAERMNPGLWGEHSRSTGESARLIAERCAGLDPESALILGLMHDIGRRYGFSHIKHTLDGYRFMMEGGWDDAAAICLTHSFPLADMATFMGRIDVPDGDYRFIERYIASRVYTDYDRLIQLCDAVSVPGGGMLIERRLMDVALRYGLSDQVLEKWKKTFELKRYFDDLAGCDIYKLLPRIVENTFDW